MVSRKDSVMTNREWNAGIEYLTTAEVGMWASHEDRTVIVNTMCGGRYTLFDHKEMCGVTDSVINAMAFLRG